MGGLLAGPGQGSCDSIAGADSGPPARAVVVGRRLAAIGAATRVPFRAVFADGSAYSNCDALGAPPAFTVTFNSVRAELRVLTFGHIGLLESYFDGSVDIDGDLALAFRAAFDSGFDHEVECAGRAAQPLARIPLFQRLASRRRSAMRAFTTAWASGSTSHGSTAWA